jgi:hypothetical protein
MEEIVGAVKRVNEIIGAITTASQEQSMGIDQVNQAMAQIDRVTQQNAALVEQAAAAADSLQDQASQLVKEIVVFKLDDTAGHSGHSSGAAIPAPAAKPAAIAKPAAPQEQPAAERTPAPARKERRAVLASVPPVKPQRRYRTKDEGDWKEF